MKTSALAVVVLLLSAFAGAQEPAQYVMNVRLLAADPANPASIEVVSTPQLRTRLGQEASLDLGYSSDQNGFRLAMTPSDFGDGRVGLNVLVQTRRNGKAATSTFTVFVGSGASPTIALLDAAGAFVRDEKGRPMFVAVDAAQR